MFLLRKVNSILKLSFLFCKTVLIIPFSKSYFLDSILSFNSESLSILCVLGSCQVLEENFHSMSQGD